jgi:hypothetical protein
MARKQTSIDPITGTLAPTTTLGTRASNIGFCPRCSGLLVRERFEDFPGEFAGLNFQGVRCVNCGEILDPLILEQRTHRPNKPKPPNNRRHFHRQI